MFVAPKRLFIRPLKKLRERIEPWLTALFQSEHLSMLAGSGLSQAVHFLAVGAAMQGMGEISLETRNDEIKKAVKESAEATGRSEGNIEDQLRVANELLRGLQIPRARERRHGRGSP